MQAIENLISAGAKGFLITPSDSKAIVPSIDKAKQAGMLVIALDTPDRPAGRGGRHLRHRQLPGRPAHRAVGEGEVRQDGKPAKIAMLDLNANQVSVDVQRDQGFLEGFGIDVDDKNKIGDETDPRIVGHDVTDGAEDGGRTAMENLLQKDPSINLVYTINEPAAAGAYQALKAAGKEKDVTIVSVDGGCPGVDAVKAGAVGATSQQYPLKMAEQGVEAIADVRQGRHQAGGDRGQGLRRHRRHADHRPAADRRRAEGHHVRQARTAGADRWTDTATGRDTARPSPGQDFDEHRHHDSLGLRIQHVLHGNPVLGPLAVLVLAIIAFSLVQRRGSSPRPTCPWCSRRSPSSRCSRWARP